jgi:hypothetical protein
MPFVAGPDMRGYVYTDGEGRDWVVRAKREVAEYADATGTVTDPVPYTGQATVGAWPANARTRSVTVAHPAQGARKVTCYSTDSRLWLGTATSIEMRGRDGIVVAFSRIKQNPEYRRAPILPEA